MDPQDIELAKIIAGKYAKYGVPFEDLVQEGLLGVLEARKRFDPERGVQFATYAAHWVRKRILLFLDHELQYRGKSVELNVDMLEEETVEEEPTDIKNDITEAMPEKAQRLLRQLYRQHRPISQITAEKPAAEKLDLPEEMPEDEKQVLRRLYEEHHPLSQIAEEMGLRREQVRQLKQKAMRRLRRDLDAPTR